MTNEARSGENSCRYPTLLNLRDVGGGPVRIGVLFRSDSCHALTSEEADNLAVELGIRHVIDLRTAAEIEVDGVGSLQSKFSYVNLPIDARAGAEIGRAEGGDDLASGYIGFLAGSASSIVAAIRSVAVTPEGESVLIHCRAGKDRTGVVIGLVLALLGVADSVILDDYTKTNAAIPGILARLRQSPYYAGNVDGWPDDYYLASPETMTSFLARVREDFGSVAAWAAAVGLTDEDLRRLRRRMLTLPDGSP